MNTKTKHLLFLPRRRALVQTCNEILVKAARDLAEFTKHGLNANFIVSLAHKCEQLEALIKQPIPRFNKAELHRMEQEIWEAMVEICETGKRIWNHEPSKYRDYVLKLAKPGPARPGPGSFHAA